MTEQERWTILRDLFARALDLPLRERDAFIALHCDDAALRAELSALLDAADREGPLDSLAHRLTPVSSLLTEQVPHSVGPYVVSERIGAGGMAVVYRAHDPRLQRDVALKFLPATLHDHTPAADRLILEARAASALDHPNICTIYDIATAGNDRLFIAMAYYPGGTLQDRLRETPLAVEAVIDITRRVAAALQCAHDAGIVHRDVKPANIAFGERGEVKVLDFGVAVLADAAATAESAGTPAYMSPEQVRGEPADARSDVWALGVVMYEMLTGRRPFAGASRREIHDLILHGQPAAIASVRRDVPQRLAAVVERALAKRPERRFQSAVALAGALAGMSAPAPAGRRRWLRGAFAAAAATVMLITIAALARSGLVPRSSAGNTARWIDEQYLRARERYVTGASESNEAAIVILRSVFDRDSTHVPSRALLASAYAVSTGTGFSRDGRREWLDSAMAHAHAAIALDPSMPDGHAALGVAYRWAGRLEDAALQHRLALGRDPQYTLSMVELGFVYHLLRQHDEAIIWLERGLALEPDVPVARGYVSALYRVFDMPDEARRHVETGRLQAPDDAGLIWESVLIAVQAGDTAFARAEYDAYIQLIPAGERERMHAWFHILLGDRRTARVHIDRVNLNDAPWYDLREFGITYIQTGARELGDSILHLALADIDRAAGSPEWGRTNPGFDRAYIHAALGNRDESIASLQSWFDNGGLRAWTREGNEHWGSVADDPRFRDLVRRSQQRFDEKRARIVGELSARRD